MANLIVGRLTTVLDARDTDLRTKIKRAKSDLNGLQMASVKTKSSVSNMFKGFAVTGIVAGLGLVSKRILDIGIESEKTRAAFNNLLNSSVAGSQLYKGIKDLAAVTPFTSRQLNDGAKRLLAFGISGEEIIPTLKRLGDISAATGADIRNLSVVFGQIKTTGRLMGQDLLQLVNAGFNPLQVISEKTGRSMQDLKKDMENGLISFEAVNQAFVDATSKGGRFYNMMSTQSKTLGGRLSTLKDEFERIGETLAEKIVPIFKDITDKLIEAAKAFNAVAKGEGTSGQKVAVGAGVGAGTVATAALVGPFIAKYFDKALNMFSSLIKSQYAMYKSITFDMVKKIAYITTQTGKKVQVSGDKIFSILALSNIAKNIDAGKKLTAIQTTLNFLYIKSISILETIIGATSLATASITAFAVAIGVVISKFREDLGVETGLISDALKGLFNPFETARGIIEALMDTKLPNWFDNLLLAAEALVSPFGALRDLFKKFPEEIKAIEKGFVKFLENVYGMIPMGMIGNTLAKANVGNNVAEFLFGSKGANEAPILNQELIAKRQAQREARRQADIAETERIKQDVGVLGNMAIGDMLIQIDMQAVTRNKRLAEEQRKQQELLDLDMADVVQKFQAQLIGVEFGLDKPDVVKNESKLAGAFAKGSIEAYRILTQQGDGDPQKQVQKNTKITAELMKRLVEEGLTLKDVGIAN